MPHRGIAGRAFLKLVDRQRVNVATADIPGPEVPLYFAGARLLEVFPLVQLIGKVSLPVGAMSYAGQFNIMVVADKDAYPDIDVFTASAENELRTCRSYTRSGSTRGQGSPSPTLTSRPLRSARTARCGPERPWLPATSVFVVACSPNTA